MRYDRRIGDGEPPLYSTNYPLRIYVSLRAIAVSCIALFEPSSFTHHMLVEGEPFGALEAFTVMGTLGLFGLLDAIINDVLPRRYAFRRAAQHRHIGFLALAALQISFMLIIVARGYHGSALLAFGIDSAVSVWIAIYHVRHRYMAPRARAEEAARRWSDYSER